MSESGLWFVPVHHEGDQNASPEEVECIFSTIKNRMATIATKEFTDRIIAINEFRNRYIAHQERELSDVEVAKRGLEEWIAALAEMLRKAPPPV